MKVTLYSRRPFPGQVSIETQFDQIRRALPANVDVRPRVSTFLSKGVFRRLFNSVEAAWHQADVNHIAGDVHYLALLLNSRRTILTVHDCCTLYGRPWLARTLLRWFWFVLPARRSAAITTISEKTRRELAGVLRIDPDRIRLIPDCVAGEFTWSPKPFQTEYPEILQIGAAPNKNVGRLARALKGIPCRLRLIGRLDRDTTATLNECGIDYVNEFDLPFHEIVDRYRACDLVSFVSTYEGFGVPILEAQATGRAVVTSNIAPMCDVAGGAACLVDPYDPNDIRRGILRLIADPEYRDSMVRKGRQNAARYSPSAVAERYSALYREICEKALNSQHESADIQNRAHVECE